jgi:hypothetical protein
MTPVRVGTMGTCRVRVWVGSMCTLHGPGPGPQHLAMYPYPHPIPTHTTSLTRRIGGEVKTVEMTMSGEFE